MPQKIEIPMLKTKTEDGAIDKKIGYYVKGEVGAELLPEMDKALDF